MLEQPSGAGAAVGLADGPARLPEAVRRVLACPQCGGRLTLHGQGAACPDPACGTTFGRSAAGLLDLRLVAPKTVTRRVSFGAEGDPPDLAKRTLPPNPRPEVDWRGLARPATLRARMQSWLPRARRAGALALDVGCGSAAFRPVLAHCGFGYVGIDVAGDAASLVADARALPFREASFELVWSNAVLQYVPHPEVALAEIHRVLQAGGSFMGTIGFLEAFDGRNMHPVTPLGAHQCFRDAGFVVEQLAPDDAWTGPIALARAMFPGLPGRAADRLVAPVDWCSRLYWRLGTLFRDGLGVEDRLIKLTGGFEFILRKP